MMSQPGEKDPPTAGTTAVARDVQLSGDDSRITWRLDPSPSVALLASHLRHWALVRAGLEKIGADLQRRATVHDLSKLDPEGEFPGFARINRAAREHPYGSKEYRAALAAEKPTVDRHYAANSHHPEHFQLSADRRAAEAMGFLDIIEMVCDWRSACVAYGNSSWAESMEVNRKRFGPFDGPVGPRNKIAPGDGPRLSAEQWWLVEEVAYFLGPRSRSD